MPFAATVVELPSPKDFYDKFVKPRHPVLLQGCASALHPKLHDGQAITIQKLLDIVGDAKDDPVEVNQRNHGGGETDDDCPSFSPQHSTVVSMPFAQVCHKLLNNSTADSYYLTTQPLPVDDEGRPALYTTPVQQLIDQDYVPLRPALLGNLLPMTCNLWMGRTSSSSGLHHDFHDNLYCLWGGCKSFRIAPPTAAHQMKMAGTVHTVHANGRIVYEEQIKQQQGGGMIRPDGALEKVEQIMELEIRRQELERMLDADDNTTVDKASLERKLDEIEEELLDLEVEEDGSDDDDDGDGDNLLFGGGGGIHDSQSSLHEENKDDSEEDQEIPPSAKRSKIDHQPSKTLPCNFVIDEKDQVKFETVHMNKGDLLYLPAGWFHEVSSRGKEGGVHMAFNYWLHPPDATTGTDFEQPYQSKFWQRDWDSRFSR